MLVTRTVHITQDHINQGRPTDCSKCPGALAIKDAFPEVGPVAVYIHAGIHIYDQTGSTLVSYYPTPEVLKTFISYFDKTGKYGDMSLADIAPICFDLTFDIPETKTKV